MSWIFNKAYKLNGHLEFSFVLFIIFCILFFDYGWGERGEIFGIMKILAIWVICWSFGIVESVSMQMFRKIRISNSVVTRMYMCVTGGKKH